MKVFYLLMKRQNVWGKFEIGVYDWGLYLSGHKDIDLLGRVRLVGHSKFGAYLLDEMSMDK